MTQHFHLKHGWFLAIFLFCAVLVLTNLVQYILFRVIGSKGKRSSFWRISLRRHLGRPARTIFLLTCLPLVLAVMPTLPNDVEHAVRQGISICMVLALGWFAVGWVYVIQDGILRRYDMTQENNIQARRVHTQFQLFRRMVIFFIVVIDAGGLLWTFDNPRIWHYGSGLLASAGLVSVLLATAAKSTVSNFLAGLQIAVSGTIRIDDVIVVEGESGRVEEINTAYVVMRVWDLRRLIIPLSYFIENSFQNWTRESAELIGTAFLYVDYTVPVEALREKLDQIVKPSPLWNGEICKLHVTNLTERTMELRCMMSSRNSGDNFELRCQVREEMMAWVRKKYPEAFPTLRILENREQATGN